MTAFYNPTTRTFVAHKRSPLLPPYIVCACIRLLRVNMDVLNQSKLHPDTVQLPVGTQVRLHPPPTTMLPPRGFEDEHTSGRGRESQCTASHAPQMGVEGAGPICPREYMSGSLNCGDRTSTLHLPLPDRRLQFGHVADVTRQVRYLELWRCGQFLPVENSAKPYNTMPTQYRTIAMHCDTMSI